MTGETVTAIELSPEGTGYRAKTRFAKFYNLPELMAAFKEVADIQTADMLKLPVPKANFHTEVIQPSEFQKEMIKGLAERAEKIRAGGKNHAAPAGQRVQRLRFHEQVAGCLGFGLGNAEMCIRDMQ